MISERSEPAAPEVCPTCEGNGEVPCGNPCDDDMRLCPECGGEGHFVQHDPELWNDDYAEYER